MSRPIRRKTYHKVITDPETGQERPTEVDHELDFLNDGSVDTFGKHIEFINEGCGCVGPVGGHCFDCGAYVCQRCFGHCTGCNKPICAQCSYSATDETGAKLRLCGRCYGKSVRRARLGKVVRLLLGPFIEFKE